MAAITGRDAFSPPADVPRPFYLEKPAQRTQTQKTPAERGGVNPCFTDDPGFRGYRSWTNVPGMGQILMPKQGGVAGDGSFDVMIHFHGHEPIRKEWVKVMDTTMLVGVDLGVESGAYIAPFGDPRAFKAFIANIEKTVAESHGLATAKVRKVGLSAWSAGYQAVGMILSDPDARELVDTVVLLDGLHASYAGTDLDTRRLAPFVEFAELAKAGKKLMYVSHSSIIPPGYASTTETENYLVFALGGQPRSVGPRDVDPWGLELNSRFDARGFHVRGFDGNDKMDHCAHIGLVGTIMKSFVKPRWTPKAQALGAQPLRPQGGAPVELERSSKSSALKATKTANEPPR
jgi:hypothetical protein